MKRLLLLAFFALLLPPAALAQEGSIDLILPQYLTSSGPYQSCSTTGSTDVKTLLSEVEPCLADKKQYMAAIIVTKAIRDYAAAHEFDNPLSFDQMRNALTILDGRIVALQQQELSQPEMPSIDLGPGNSCETSVVEQALSKSSSELVAERTKALDNLTASPNITLSEAASMSDWSLDINAQAQSFIESARGHEGVGQCQFSKADWNAAIEAYKDALHIGANSQASDYWHLAIAYEHLGRRSQAALSVRSAYNALASGDPLSTQIKYDYNRLGAAKQDAIAAEKAREVARREAAAVAHEQLAENHEYWDSLSADEREVISEQGGTRDSNEDMRPCSTAVSNNSYVGELLIWYYDFVTSGGIGKESYTFTNGTLTDHTIL